MSSKEVYMSFVTGIHFGKSMLRTLNGITFLFDPNWQAGYSDTATFPVTFFHIKSIHETMEADISQKQMLFYNSQSSFSPNSTTGGLLNVVADNIVIKPKTYKMDVIIPYDDLSLLTNNYTMNPDQLAGVTSVLTTKELRNLNVMPYLTLATPFVDIIKTLLKSLLAADFSSIPNFITSVTSTPDYNKNSLEAMFRNRSILKLKLWNGWKYKYVALKSIDITKEPDEDGVYEATLVCQEVPILTIKDSTGLTSLPYVNPILTAAGEGVKTVLNKMEVN